MEVIWEAGEPLAVRDAMKRLDAGLAYTTVMTTLDRLHKKKLLARRKDGNAFVYRPAMTRDDYHRRIVEETLSGLLEKSAGPVLNAFVDVAVGLDEENLERLEALIARHRSGK